MKTIVIDQPFRVAQRLRELSLNPKVMLEILETMVSARRSWTPNDVAGAGGTRAYLDGTRRAREVCAPLGWLRDSEGNLESMVNEQEGLRVVVCNANENAGVADLNASNRNPKGPATEQVVALNSEQATFFELLEEVDAQNMPHFESEKRPGGLTTWYLFVFADDETYRAELSCPITVEAGYLANCRERIILVRDGDNDNNLRPRRTVSPEGDSEFAITVTRKSA